MENNKLLWGIVFIILGSYLFYNSHKNPDKQLKSVTIGGFFIGFIFITMGALLVFKFIFSIE